MIFGVRIITSDVDRLVKFYELVTGLTAARPTPFFAELRTDAGLIAIATPATVAMLDSRAPAPGANNTVILELLVEDADLEFDRIGPQLRDVVLPPTTMPWGNCSVMFRDPEGNLINVFSRPR